MTTLYGIHNCDTVKKTRKWLDDNKIEYQFHDFRKDGLNASQVKHWIKELGWEKVVNKRSTTWRQLDEKTKNSLDAASASTVILDNPTLIKRPVLENKQNLLLGFKSAEYQDFFGL